MRVLLLHNRYQHAGGEDVVVSSESALLESCGHTVELQETHNEDISGIWNKVRAGMSALYSLDGRRRAAEAIERFRPDIVHVHNFFPLLSPSVYDACRAKGVPVVQTLHNYRLACPNALLFRAGRICEDCLDQPIPWPGALRGCYRGSRSQSASVGLMLAAHRLRNTWNTRVDAFIALTEFQKGKLVRSGLPPDLLHVKPNFAFDPGVPDVRRALGNYAIYVGRLSVEKGIEPLLQAYIQHRLTIPLNILGEGPMRERMQCLVVAAGLSHVIRFLGPQERSEVSKLMHGARFLVFPSICYEGFPMAIAEAFAAGIPVLASRLGAIPDILQDGAAGWLATPGDPDSWALVLRAAWADLEGTKLRGRAARQTYEQFYTPQANYRQLCGIYEGAVNRSKCHAKHA